MKNQCFITSLVLLGSLFATVTACVKGAPKQRLRTFGVVSFLTLSIYLPGLFCFAAASKLVCSWELLFPNRASQLIGAYLYLLTSLAVGLGYGCIQAGGMQPYLRQAIGSRVHRSVYFCFLALNVAITAAGVGLTYSAGNTNLEISEVCGNNFNLLATPAGTCPDYIELYNPGPDSLNLKGYYLSDSRKKPKKCALPALVIPAGGYAIAWADGSQEPAAADTSELHLNFRISAGETIRLSAPNGNCLDVIELPELPCNVSLTRLDEEWMMAYGTPGRANVNCQLYTPATLPQPQFSQSGGFYEGSVTLEMTAAEDCKIFYTLDGSKPDAESLQYTGPITLKDVSQEPNRYVNVKNTVPDYNTYFPDDAPVPKANVVRAIAIDDTGAYSPVTSATYFVGDFSAYTGYSVLSIVADPEDLFGNNGICVTGPAYDAWYESGQEGEAPVPNFRNHGPAWEREATIQLWDSDGACVLNQSCGIRLQGNMSRNYAVKRFSLYARSMYGTADVFTAPIFEDWQSHSFYLRDDVYDFMAQLLIEDRDIGILRCIPVAVFLDGEFYQLSYMRERYDSSYFMAHFNVDPDNLVVISDNKLDIGQPEDYQLYVDFLQYVQSNDASDPKVYEKICKQMDIQSYIDFLCANLYCNNVDWSFYKNYHLWRTRAQDVSGYSDGRWRWLAYDMDAVGWSGDILEQTRAEIDTFHCNLPYTGNNDYHTMYIDMPLFSDLLKNPDFKQQFVLTYLDMMNVNFNLNHAWPLLEHYGLTEHWLWSSFLAERPAYALENLIQALELAGQPCQVALTVSDPSGGTITVNTTQANTSDGTWTGTYLTEYPITLTAIPAPGWEFVGWQGDIRTTEPTLTARLTGDTTAFTAVFAPVEQEGG